MGRDITDDVDESLYLGLLSAASADRQAVERK